MAALTFDRALWQKLQKPERRRVVKQREKRKKGLSRRQCREIVYRREAMRCERCQKLTKRFDECYPWDPDMAHVNENPPRSRGGDPTNPDTAELTCGACHMPNGEHAPTVARMQQIQARMRKKTA